MRPTPAKRHGRTRAQTEDVRNPLRRLPQFKEHNAAIVGASVDSVYCHQAWVTTPQKQARDRLESVLGE